jgi:predicted dehydrogenase
VDPKNGNQVLERAVNTVPDHLLIHGTVQPSQAVVAIIFTGGDEIPGIPVLDWRIQGESGWLRLTSSSMALNVGSPDTKLGLYDASGKVGEVSPEEDQWSKLPLPAQNIARMYEAYRKKDWYPDFDYAIKTHELIETMWRDFDQAEVKTR